MGHHLLNGVKCVKEVRGLTNALIILNVSLHGQREESNGGEVWQAPKRTSWITTGGLQDDKVSSHSCTHAARCLLMCPNRHWEFGQKIIVALSHSQSFPDKKGGNALFFPLQRFDIILARHDLLFIIPVTEVKKKGKKWNKNEKESPVPTLFSRKLFRPLLKNSHP